MIKTITYKGKTYPKYKNEGYASRFTTPHTEQICKGVGADFCNKFMIFGEKRNVK